MGVFGEEGDFEVGLSCVLEGCTDVTACNYDPEASSDDGSCTYPEEDYLDCDSNCVNDVDADGVCDELEVEGIDECGVELQRVGHRRRRLLSVLRLGARHRVGSSADVCGRQRCCGGVDLGGGDSARHH